MGCSRIIAGLCLITGIPCLLFLPPLGIVLLALSALFMLGAIFSRKSK